MRGGLRLRRARMGTHRARRREESSRFTDDAVRRGGLEEQRIDSPAFDPFRRVGRGHDENRDIRRQRITPQDLAEGVSVDERKSEFCDDQRRRRGEGFRQRVTTIGRLDDVLAGAGERVTVERPRLGVGIGNQHDRRWKRRRISLGTCDDALVVHCDR